MFTGSARCQGIHEVRDLTSKVTGDPGASEAPPAGVRVDRWVGRHYIHARYVHTVAQASAAANSAKFVTMRSG